MIHKINLLRNNLAYTNEAILLNDVETDDITVFGFCFNR
jgi:hypothetical protein